MQFSEFVYSVSKSQPAPFSQCQDTDFRIIKPENKNWIPHFFCCPFSEE
jgi:hypothetical protein